MDEAKAEARKARRRKRGTKRQRDVMIQIWLHRHERERLAGYAAETGVPVSTWARAVLLGTRARPKVLRRPRRAGRRPPAPPIELEGE